MTAERDLFLAAVAGAKPITPTPKPPSVTSKPKPRPIPVKRLEDEADALSQSQLSDMTAESVMDSDGDLSFSRNGISSDTVRRLRRGHWVVQASLDLHGLRTDQAREALGQFIRNSVKRGFRCVRIIHGKGLGSMNKKPVLKSKVRNWLVQKDEVIAFVQARAADGGSGALVVLLKG